MFLLIFHEKFVSKLEDATAEGQQLCKESPSTYTRFLFFISTVWHLMVYGFINVSPRKMVFEVCMQIEVFSVRVQGSSKEFLWYGWPRIFVCLIRRS